MITDTLGGLSREGAVSSLSSLLENERGYSAGIAGIANQTEWFLWIGICMKSME